MYLGKWNKIHFLGLEGPSDQLMIPNNVKQELKFWEGQERNRERVGIFSSNFDAEKVSSDDEDSYYRYN